ncbi:hypothetical protein MPSEU_000598700 [Mayamaea pseudoterrestris]|nr:hypothetical protein MPSEU_000598700 [Mayamaea pseudoterrestris]
MNTPIDSTSPFTLTELYLKRLNLDTSFLAEHNGDRIAPLKAIHESHLERIPFENTAQHGVVGGPAVLDIRTTANKVLNKGRGGFCLELNLLFGAWLEELDFSVTRVPAFVANEGEFRGDPTHVVLIVHTSNNGDRDHSSNEIYLCDVGFGEPALHPLLFEMELEQVTPEGMCSKFGRLNGGDEVVLYWKKDGAWRPRLKWSYSACFVENGPSLLDFESALRTVQSDASPFSQKLIVCKLTRTKKTTMAGNKIKFTLNRFSSDESVTNESLAGSEEARKKLLEIFDYPLESSAGLDLTRSIQAEAALWSHM